MEAVIVRSANGKIKKVAPDPLEKWLSSYPEKHREEKRRKLDRFLAYVKQQKGWQGTDYRTLIIRHLESEYEEEVPDLLQDYIKANQSKWRYNSLQNEYSTGLWYTNQPVGVVLLLGIGTLRSMPRCRRG